MEVKEVLFMNKGEGESSYAHNSAFSNSQKVASMAKPIIERAVQSLFTKDFYHYKVLNIADLGCSSAPNTFPMMSTVTESVEKKCRELNCLLPEFQFYLNDLPGNDFNTLFKGLSSFLEKNKGISCFVMGAPGSFYDRLFPANSLHLVHSCYSVHWLSQAPRHTNEEGLPLNKGKIYISKTSPPAVRQAYLDQFQKDFALFLKLRSQEMVPDGRVVLILQGRQSADPASKENCHPWELLSEAIADMVQQGLIDEEKLNSFDVPYYIPSTEEVQDVVDWERSFTTELMETFALEEGDKNMRNNGKKVANNIRSFTESIIAHHFGVEILDKLYDKFTNMVIEDLAKESTKVTSITVVLKRNEI